MKYRNRLVHDQPPTVEGLGIVYERRKRWRQSKSSSGHTLAIGGFDQPEYSVTKLVNFIQPALLAFTDALTLVVDHYIKLLKPYGITLEDGELKVTV